MAPRRIVPWRVTQLTLTLGVMLALAGCRGAAGAPDAARSVDLERDLDFAMQSARAGLWNEALYRWERALALLPDDPKLHNNLAIAYEHEGRYEEARRQYEKARELDPEDDHVRRNIEAFESFYSGEKKKEGEGVEAAEEEAEPDDVAEARHEP